MESLLTGVLAKRADLDLVIEDIRFGFVGIESFLDDGLIVGVQRQAGRIENARALEAARGFG